ncbi:hypothetical protein M5D96_014154 [Drosophila gunungcola]|uniref:Uncharacterized protein n=1 Tax=Drosophila gunungcola TaxID=103775 RepID=A0A9P9YAJ2_9MUSC|nr:hypothetical protein M5D96_014154 [Drosophila gunungcola]
MSVKVCVGVCVCRVCVGCVFFRCGDYQKENERRNKENPSRKPVHI